MFCIPSKIQTRQWFVTNYSNNCCLDSTVYTEDFTIFNPRCMRRRVTVVVLSVCASVCLSVTTKSATYLVYTSKTRCHRILYGRFCRVAFAENALFKSYGVIYWSLPPSLLPNDVSIDKRDSNNFFSTQRVCVSSDSSKNTTDSSLTGAN